MSTVMPPIGRNGIVNSVRKLSGNIVTGWREVASDASFIAGQAAVLDANGKLAVADNTAGANIVGLFFCHKTTSFYKPIVDEAVTCVVDGDAVNLANANVQSTTILVELASDGTNLSADDYTLSATNGTLALDSGGTNTLTATASIDVLVTYRYQDPNLTGIDQTLGSGRAAVIEGNGEIATLVYDTAVDWSINADVKINASGLVSTTGNVTIGFVTKAPSANDPELQFQMRLPIT